MLKRFIIFLTVIVLIAAMAIPAAALGQPVTENRDYIIEESCVIGWDKCPIFLRGDGSFEHTEHGAAVYVTFGERNTAARVAKNDLPYPVATHTYTKDGVDYTVEQFALGDESGAVCVYSRFTVKNTTDAAVPFPTVKGTVPVSQAPTSVEKGKSASCDYIVSVRASDAQRATDSLKAETFDTAKAKMIAHWDGYIAEKLTVTKLSADHETALSLYRTLLVEHAVTGTPSPADAIASDGLSREVLSKSSDVYACALAIIKTGDAAALSSLDSIRNVANDIIYSEKDLPYLSMEENLEALLTLQSYGYILKKLSAADALLSEEAAEVSERAALLADSIALAVEEAQKDLPCDWEVATTDASAPIVLTGKDCASAKALCSWYIKSAPFTDAPSKKLVALAKDANAYYSAPDDCAAAILSILTEREDGTLIIGRGAPVSLLSQNASFTVDNVTLSSKSTVSLTVKVNKNNIDITVSGAASTPIQVEFPVMTDNIEYASAGFDSESGVVTAPEGTSSISVRLAEKVTDSESARKAGADLEVAICRAYENKVESPTTVSKNEFDTALKRAESVRTATVEEKNSAAASLRAATEALSPMVAGYSHVIPEGGVGVGTITKSEVYEKFSLPSAGTVTGLFVKGEYSEGISAAVYTLRGDNYTTDELRGECYGEEAEGGIFFPLDFEAEQDKVYVLCIFSEDGDVSLSLESSEDATAHTVEAGATVVYAGASLSLDFTVRQADRKDLDKFYNACLESDVSGFTKESRKTLNSKMKAAKALLCTQSVTEEECEKVYDELKKAYDGLDTYASEDKIEETPIVGLVLIGIVIVLLIATFLSAMAARKRMNPDS